MSRKNKSRERKWHTAPGLNWRILWQFYRWNLCLTQATGCFYGQVQAEFLKVIYVKKCRDFFLEEKWSKSQGQTGRSVTYEQETKSTFCPSPRYTARRTEVNGQEDSPVCHLTAPRQSENRVSSLGVPSSQIHRQALPFSTSLPAMSELLTYLAWL